MKLTWYKTDHVDGLFGTDEHENKLREINCHHVTINIDDETKLEVSHAHDNELSIYCDGQMVIFSRVSNSIVLSVKKDLEEK